MLVTILYPKINFFKTSLLCYFWIAVSLLYFGVSLGITSIEDINPYLIVLFSSISEAIGYSLCFYNKKFGHRRTNMFYMTIAALMCLAIGLTQKYFKIASNIVTVFIIILTALGKCMVSASFNTCFVYSSEFYPTHIRNFALLFLSSLGCVGSIVAPQINLLS